MVHYRDGRWVAWVLCAMLVGTTVWGQTGTEDQARQSLRKGLDWLKTLQRPDGSWSQANYPALTALGLWAFARSDHPDQAVVCSNAARFVVSFVQEDGGIYKPAGVLPGGGGLSTYNTAICMTALHAYDRVTYAPVILAARKFMVGSQRLGDSPGAGGFSYEQTPPLTMKVIGAITGRGGRADLSNTGWSLQALRLTRDLEEMRPGGQVVDIDWPAALRFVDRLQNTDSSDPVDYGGFGYAGNSERGGTVASTNGAVRLAAFGSMTYAGLESLIYAQVDRRDPRIESAIQWTARHWSVDENPGMGTRGLFYYYAIMAKALSLTGSDLLPGASGTPIPWKKDLVEKLVKTQRADGSWVNEDNSYWEGDAALVTSYAALALESVLGR